MKITHVFPASLALCSVLVACGGGQKPAVEPDAQTDAAVSKPAMPDLNNPTDRYSYALGMDLGKAIANVNVPLNMDVLMGAIKDQVDSTRPVQMSDSASESALQDLWLCRAKLYTCARLAKNPQSVSPSKTVFRLHDRCFYAEMVIRRSAACSQLYGLA